MIHWHEPNKFLVSGTDDRKRLHRVSLRFENQEKAQRVANEIRAEIPTITEKPIPESFQPTVIPVQIHFLYSTGELLKVFFRGSIAIFLLWIFETQIDFPVTNLVFIIVGFLLLWTVAILFLNFWTMRRRASGTLRFDEDSIFLIPPFIELSPQRIEWEDNQSLNVKMRGRKLSLAFRTQREARDALQQIRQRFPEVVETYYDPSFWPGTD